MLKKIKYWFENYWYYYKWPVIISSFFIIVILFCIFNTGDKKKYDARIVFAGPMILTSDEDNAASNAFAQMLSEDTNSDGVKNIDFNVISGFTTEQIQEALSKNEGQDPSYYSTFTKKAADTSFTQQFVAGEASIFLLDSSFYKTALESGALVKISDILGHLPNGANDEYSIKFSSLPIAKWFSAFEKFPEDTLLCIRGVPQISSIGKSDADEKFNISAELFKKIVNFGQ